MEYPAVFKTVLAFFLAGIVLFTFALASLVEDPCKSVANDVFTLSLQNITNTTNSFGMSNLPYYSCSVEYTYVVNSVAYTGSLKIPTCSNATTDLIVCYDWNRPSRHQAAIDKYDLNMEAYKWELAIAWVGVGLMVPMLIFSIVLTIHLHQLRNRPAEMLLL